MIFENATTRTKQGDIGEARAIYEYSRMGYVVSKPLCDSAKYDLVIEDQNGKLLKVQVKTSNHSILNQAEVFTVQLATTGGNTKVNTTRLRQSNDYDILFVLTGNDQCFSIPVEALEGAKRSINVNCVHKRSKYLKYRIN